MLKGHTGKIVFGIIWLLIGIILIGGNINGYQTIPEEPPRPQSLPNDIPNMSLCTNSSSLKANDSSAFIIMGEWGKIEFDSMDTLEGLWEGNLVEVNITSPYYGTWTVFDEGRVPWHVYSPEALWDNPGVQIENNNEKATPYLLILFSEEDCLHNWINGNAKMSVFYPAWKGGYEWETRIKHVERSFKFYAVTPQEANAIDAYINWESNVSSQNTATLWALLIGLIVFVLPGIILIVHTFKKRD